ncbi:STAS domain-containing protein [uncultured Endozoicomonas sp.]|uniref:STAS domain-containing protein n=1 Tax=uncultured Endozoicomonas sp. TaxID=432652 RepID=UPI00261C7B28|nr:STAS domain-containing protein [uncultured Endozoicomonas sp.]
MPFDTKNESNHLVVSVDEARLDASIAENFKDYLFNHIDQDASDMVIDLSVVRFMDSSGLGVLVSALKKMDGKSKIKLAGAQPAVLDLFHLTSMDKLFSILPTVTEAIEEK